MRRIFLALAATAGLAACGDTLLERGASGAAIGAGTALVLDQDVATGAVVGAGVGVATDLVN